MTYEPPKTKVCILCGEKFKHRKNAQRCKKCLKLDLNLIRKRQRFMFAAEYKRKAIKELGDECSMCGFKNINCLAFHHVNQRDKSFGITFENINKYSLAELNKEVKKCILLCHNCHWLTHHGESFLMDEVDID